MMMNLADTLTIVRSSFIRWINEENETDIATKLQVHEAILTVEWWLYESFFIVFAFLHQPVYVCVCATNSISLVWFFLQNKVENMDEKQWQRKWNGIYAQRIYGQRRNNFCNDDE